MLGLLSSSSQQQHAGVLEMAARALLNICWNMPDISKRAAAAGAVQALQQISSTNHAAHAALAAIAPYAAPRTGAEAAAAVTQPSGAAAAAAATSTSGPSSSPQQPRVCAVCGKQHSKQHKLRVCSGCQSVRYCSTECQQAHWRQHRKDCAGAGGRRKA